MRIWLAFLGIILLISFSLGQGDQPKLVIKSNAANITCPGNLFEITTTHNDRPIYGVLIRLLLVDPYEGVKQGKETEPDGRAVFDLTKEKEGKYQVEITAVGYSKPTEIIINFARCKIVEQPAPAPPPQAPVPQPAPEPVPAPPTQVQPVVPEPTPEPPPAAPPKTPTPEPPKAPAPKGFDFGQIGIVAVAGLVLIAIYFFLSKRKQ